MFTVLNLLLCTSCDPCTMNCHCRRGAVLVPAPKDAPTPAQGHAYVRSHTSEAGHLGHRTGRATCMQSKQHAVKAIDWLPCMQVVARP
jgi:hypothetical protein